MCETEIQYETNSVKCQCTSLDNAFQGVFLVNVPLPEEEVYENNSKPFVAITVFMALITVFVPFAASYLDMKDVSKASERELELKAD
jgi:pilus assembly protein TadC